MKKDKECLDCGKEKKYRDTKIRRCAKCHYKWNRGANNPLWKGGGSEKKCSICGSIRFYKSGDKKIDRCSHCYRNFLKTRGTENHPNWIAENKKTRCLDCGKKNGYKLRCWDCFLKWNKGENHHNWAGGGKKCIVCGEKTKNQCKQIKRCRKCYTKWHRGSNHKDWKGGRLLLDTGYVRLMVNGKPFLEHRYIMEQHIGRKLDEAEVIHHLNGIRDDNRIENLEITNSHDHEKWTLSKLQAKRIRELEGIINNNNSSQELSSVSTQKRTILE